MSRAAGPQPPRGAPVAARPQSPGGYLTLAQKLCENADAARPWNFGPAAGDAQPVQWVVERLAELWDGRLRWETDAGENPPEVQRLELDSSAAEAQLGWQAGVGIEAALGMLVRWHEALAAGADMRAFSLGQIEEHSG